MRTVARTVAAGVVIALLAACGCTMDGPGVTGSDDQPGAAPLVPAGGPRTGPALTLRTNVLGDYLFPAAPYATEPVFERDRLAFDWFAVPDNGDIITGYSHAYDDTLSWTPWSLDDRHFEITPTLGEHSLFVRALDDSGRITLGRIPVEVVETALDSYILVVDDYTQSEGILAWGTDAMRDAFYDTLLSGYERPAADFDALGGPPGVSVLAGASTVVWEADTVAPGIRGMFDSAGTRYDVFAGYVRVGGNLVLCGQNLIGQILDEPYPVHVSFSDTARDRVFVRDHLGIRGARNSGVSSNLSVPWDYGYCFHGAEPAMQPPAAHGEFEPMHIDSLGKWWVLYGKPLGTPYHRAGMPYIDAPEPCGPNAIVAFTFDSWVNVTFDGAPCSVMNLSGTTGGNTCCFGFPLYYLKTPDVLAVMDLLLASFGEVKVVGTGVPED